MGFHRPKHPFPPHQPKSPLRRGQSTCVGGAEKGCSIKHPYHQYEGIKKKTTDQPCLSPPPRDSSFTPLFFPGDFFFPRLLFSSLSSLSFPSLLFFPLSSLSFPSLLFLFPRFSFELKVSLSFLVCVLSKNASFFN